ncbi:hypothetical protein BOX15_Mlig027248g2 [Macrostomum lignano]|uniref:Uncharacterized protein n=1 Tax=Macrostomum lignano TaxID=282301 RepID=A0A267DJA9_9PLAT|nr:hypothetical protein BOX15_Mlig027248g1 [Macrostomum lignano]PAA90997.1 hypothetical protein BOX15_Mlig027248g2 [Macrostomum lignano]
MPKLGIIIASQLLVLAIAQPFADAFGCGFYQRGRENASILDCRTSSAVEAYAAAGYTVQRKIFIPVSGATAWHGRPVWTLSPPLTKEEAINHLQPDAFQVESSDKVDALSLRRLRQRDSLDLTALHRLRQLNRLELAESNATCLQRGLFSTPSWMESSDSGLANQLVSLRLTDNFDLVCIQTGALDELVGLTELRISGSPRLKSLGGASELPALVRLELPTETPATLRGNADVIFCSVGASLRYLDIDSSLAFLWQPLISLANITSLRVQPSPGEAVEAVVQRLVLKQQVALCAVWPSGHLQLNGISIANLVADQLAMDYADEFCADVGDAVIKYTARAEQRCGQVNDSQDNVCADVCQSQKQISPSPSTIASTTPTNSKNATAHIQPNQRDNTENILTKKTGKTVEVNGPGMDRQGVIGTTLLTAGAFLGGALIAAYCCHSRRRMAAAARLKLTGRAVITGCPAASPQLGSGKSATGALATGQVAARAEIERGELEQIRLIGYTARLGDTDSRVFEFKETSNGTQAAAASDRVRIVMDGETDEMQGDGALLTAEL